MGGKSRKTGGISKALIDRIKAGGKLDASGKKRKKGSCVKVQREDPFGISVSPSTRKG